MELVQLVSNQPLDSPTTAATIVFPGPPGQWNQAAIRSQGFILPSCKTQQMGGDPLKNGCHLPSGQQQYLSKFPLLARHLIQKVILDLVMGVSPVTHPFKFRSYHCAVLNCPFSWPMAVVSAGLSKSMKWRMGSYSNCSPGGSGSGAPSDSDSRPVDTGLSTACFRAAQTSGRPRSCLLPARTFFLSPCLHSAANSGQSRPTWRGTGNSSTPPTIIWQLPCDVTMLACTVGYRLVSPWTQEMDISQPRSAPLGKQTRGYERNHTPGVQ